MGARFTDVSHVHKNRPAFHAKNAPTISPPTILSVPVNLLLLLETNPPEQQRANSSSTGGWNKHEH